MTIYGLNGYPSCIKGNAATARTTVTIASTCIERIMLLGESLQEEQQHEHGHGKREGKQKDKTRYHWKIIYLDCMIIFNCETESLCIFAQFHKTCHMICL
jgi:hypothetical protein